MTMGLSLINQNSMALLNTEGWWHTIVAKDLNGDGNMDFVLGNHGLNSFFKASADKPVTMYVNDFDLNGSVEQIICYLQWRQIISCGNER